MLMRMKQQGPGVFSVGALFDVSTSAAQRWISFLGPWLSISGLAKLDTAQQVHEERVLAAALICAMHPASRNLTPRIFQRMERRRSRVSNDISLRWNSSKADRASR